MGMDVFGKNPKNETGDYFRNNVWYWRPLWDYCCQVGESVISEEVAESCHYNDGAGLDEEGAEKLAEILRQELESGRVEERMQEYRNSLADLPREDCDLCNSTGIRTDEVGVEYGMPERELPVEMQILIGRTHGYCNGCNGEGTRTPWQANYPFEVENVRQFADFLANCGGFEVC